MLSAELNPTQIGTVGEQLVRYKLMRWGYEAVMLEQGNPYDLLVVNPLTKIQVKSRTKPDPSKANSYKYSTRKGGACSDYYKEGDVDCFAFVALDLELIYFTPPIIDTKCKRIGSHKFTPEQQHQSWLDIMAQL